SQGRWIGVLMFTWREPRQFDERDRRIYTALLQQATRAIDSVRLFEETRERAARAELLLEVNAALSSAADEADILNAIALFSARYNARSLTISYLDTDESGQLTLRDVAVWQEGRTWWSDPEQDAPYPLWHYPLATVWTG